MGDETCAPSTPMMAIAKEHDTAFDCDGTVLDETVSSHAAVATSSQASATTAISSSACAIVNNDDKLLLTSTEFAQRLLPGSRSLNGPDDAASEGDVVCAVDNAQHATTDEQGSLAAAPRPSDSGEWLEPRVRARNVAAIAQVLAPIDDGVGTDDAARVLVVYCRERGGDARTLRIVVDSLLKLEPQLEPAELLACLEAFLPRFAPVALMPEAGVAMVFLCELFEQLLLFHDPEVAFLFRRAQIGAETYCAPWLLTAHAADVAEPSAVLRIWSAWLDAGEALDPVFFGLARLQLCRAELLLCGPGPQLGQLLHACLYGKEHVKAKVVDACLHKASELKVMTPLSFLRRLQHALLKPPEASVPPVAPPSLPPQASDSAHPSSAGAAAVLASRGVAVAKAAAAAARRVALGDPMPAPPPGARAQKLVCMRVEPQDVLMMETVMERHLRKDKLGVCGFVAKSSDGAAVTVDKSSAHDYGAHGEHGPSDGSIGATQSSANDGRGRDNVGGCRLLPKLVDLRPILEARSRGVKGSIGVDLSSTTYGVEEFLAWAVRREQEASAFGLRPMHVLMTADGSLLGDQQCFTKGLLERGMHCVAVLGGGYESLRPFLADKFAEEHLRVQVVEKAQEAKEALQKGLGSLNAWWQKAPTRRGLLERVAPAIAGGKGIGKGTAEEASRSTFDRAPLPPPLVGALNGPSAASGYTSGVSFPAAAAVVASPMTPTVHDIAGRAGCREELTDVQDSKARACNDDPV